MKDYVNKKTKIKEGCSADIDEARRYGQKTLRRLIAHNFRKDIDEEDKKREANEMRKELVLQAILTNNYLKVPLNKNYLVEVPYEPFKRQIINEKDSHDWICMVDDDTCLMQGAKYRTDLVTKLIETDYGMIRR